MARSLAVLVSCLLLAQQVILQGTARQQGVTTPYNNVQDKNLSREAPSEHDNLIQLVSSAPISIKVTTDHSLNLTATEVAPSQARSSTVPPIMSSTAEIVTTVEKETSRYSTLSLSADTSTTPTPTTTAQTTTTQQTTGGPSPTTTFTTRLPPIPTTRATVAAPRTTFTHSTISTTFAPSTISTTFTPSTISATKTPTGSKASNPHNLETRSGHDGKNRLQRCPRPEDIHPCECIEVATPSIQDGSQSAYKSEYEVETVAFCKNIRNEEVLRVALKGMQGRHMTYLVLDSVHLPPFPNNLFKNVGVGWMEVLNSTMQFSQQFFQCYEQGCF